MSAPSQSKGLSRYLLGALAGAVAGLVVTGPLLLLPADTLSRAGTGAIAMSSVGVAYFLMGLLVGLGTLAPNWGAKLLNVAGPEDLQAQHKSLLWGAASFLAYAVAMLVVTLSGPVGLVPKGVALVTVVIAAMIVVGMQVTERNREDELARLVSREAALVTVNVGVPTLLGWAVLEYLNLLPPINPLWLIALLSLLLLTASFVAAGRRGLLSQD